MKDNILRGILLNFLKKVYPEGASYETILSIFFQYHKSDDITAALAYLSDKEYIKKFEQPHLYFKQEIFLWYKITPHGIDLQEGSIPADPGITIQRS